MHCWITITLFGSTLMTCFRGWTELLLHYGRLLWSSCSFCVGYPPLSWHKAALDTSLVWIGWSLDVASWTLQVPDDKLSKILSQVQAVSSGKRVPLKDLQSLVGRLLWLTTAWHHLRPLLIPLYKAIQQIPLTMVGVDHAVFSELAARVDDHLTLQSSLVSKSKLKHHSLIVGVRVQRVANTFVKTKADLQSVLSNLVVFGWALQILHLHCVLWRMMPWMRWEPGTHPGYCRCHGVYRSGWSWWLCSLRQW